MPKEHLSSPISSFTSDQAIKVLKKGNDDMPLLDKDKKFISEKLKNDFQLTVGILLKCRELEPEETKRVINNLIKLEAFNKITINLFTKHLEKTYSLSYLLLSTLEGRQILKENSGLKKLIGESLSKDLINQFVDDTHDGALYYLLTDPIGHELLEDYPHLKTKIDSVSLDRMIKTGPEKGKTLKNFYDEFFSPKVSHSSNSSTVTTSILTA